MKGKGLGVKALEILNLSDPGIFSAITMANNTFWDLFGSCIVYVRFVCQGANHRVGKLAGAGRGGVPREVEYGPTKSGHMQQG